mmetsp:Transcript_77626/g.154198  ORF Transcript_77626/g.154198 Transcript_77626/m.154198 type:complete len:94 (-) Transcript_77626:20-301(-)
MAIYAIQWPVFGYCTWARVGPSYWDYWQLDRTQMDLISRYGGVTSAWDVLPAHLVLLAAGAATTYIVEVPARKAIFACISGPVPTKEPASSLV